ncbi:MAG: hypothetical protein Q8L86_08500 [Vicinamibacterales bacterium]|nr:hypothetical protein [Vicinamibacterales bacterium]
MRFAGILALVLVAAASSACRSNAPLEVSGIQLGRSLNTDNTVGNLTTTFSPSDTVYVSVLTGDTGSGTIAVRWEHEGRLASEFSKRVSYKGAAATEFHLQYPGGLPEGNYAVELFVDEASVGRRTFAVRR